MGELERIVTVAEIMRPQAPVVSPSDSIATVARVLADHGIPGVPVVEAGKIVGIITEGDLVAREAAVNIPAIVPFLDAILIGDAGRSFGEEMRRVLALSARELMSSPVYSIKATASLSQLATLMMERRVNPVPVVSDAHELVGLVSRADLVRVVARLESAESSLPEPA